MSLHNYIKRVGCVSPRASAFEAAREMKANGVGTVVVISDDQRPIGLLTDRDLALRVVAERKNAEQTSVEEVMTHGAVTLPNDASIRSATELMSANAVRRIPIVDELGRVIGIITLDDILVLLGMEIGNLANTVFSGMAEESEAAVSP
jgi:CBS domain-containing protein